MVVLEEVLWNIFTFYTLNGNPKDPSKLNCSGLVKFCKEILIFDVTMTEKPLSAADVSLIYTSEIRSPKKFARSEKADKLEFDEFLACLMRIAQKCYPNCLTKDDAMEQLLMGNILPLASRRKPLSVAAFLRQPVVESLFKYYEDALGELFKFFAAASDQSVKSRNMVKSMSNSVKTFDDHKELIEAAKVKNLQQQQTANLMGYSELIRFANDFGLTTSLGITALDLGDIYLTVISFSNFSPTLRKIDFREFWEVLMRCALLAFKDKARVTSEDKLKGLFHYIWKHTQSATQDYMIGYGTLHGGGFNAYRGKLLRGAQMLNERFVAAWTRDGYRDYLEPQPLVSAKPAAKESAALPESPAKVLLAPSLLSKISMSPRKLSQNSLLTAAVREEDAMQSLLHERVEDRDMITVQSPNGLWLKMRIENADFGEGDRLTAADLRKLLSCRPDIATILYECAVEEGILTAGADEAPSSPPSEPEPVDGEEVTRPRTKSRTYSADEDEDVKEIKSTTDISEIFEDTE